MTRGRPGSRWWECVWADIKKGRTVDLMEVSRNGTITWKQTATWFYRNN